MLSEKNGVGGGISVSLNSRLDIRTAFKNPQIQHFAANRNWPVAMLTGDSGIWSPKHISYPYQPELWYVEAHKHSTNVMQCHTQRLGKLLHFGTRVKIHGKTLCDLC